MANIREIALNIIIEYYRDGTRKPSLLKDSLNKYDYLESRDKAFMKRVVDGCLERQIQIDYILDKPISKHLTEKQKSHLHNLIDNLVNESDRVRAVRSRINANLRAFISSEDFRSRTSLPLPPHEYPAAVRWSRIRCRSCLNQYEISTG